MFKWIGISILVVIADQMTKSMATEHLAYMQHHPVFPFFNFTLMHNEGAAFSFLHDAGGWQRWLFVALAGIISVTLIIWIARLEKTQTWLAIALALILGGALGNGYDRIMLGYVVDFIDFYYDSWHFPAFNIADSAITIGAIMLLIDAFIFPEKNDE